MHHAAKKELGFLIILVDFIFSTTAPCSSTRSGTSRARQSKSRPRSGTLRGPLREWWLPAFSAGHLTRRASISRLPTFRSTTSAPRAGRCALRHPRHVCRALCGVLTGDFNNCCEGEILSSGSGGQLRLSPLEAAFSFAGVPWPTSRRHTAVLPWR